MLLKAVVLASLPESFGVLLSFEAGEKNNKHGCYNRKAVCIRIE